MTNAEATGAEVLDSYFPDNQFETLIHASSKVCEGKLAVAARGDVQARQPPREGLREARRGGAPWLGATASGFTISGLLDKNAATRSDYPIERIPVDEIARPSREHGPIRWTMRG